METVFDWYRAGYNMFFLEYYHPEELKKQNPDAYFPTAADMFIPSIIFGLFLIVVRYTLDRQVLCYFLFVCLMVFNATFNTISVMSWQSVLLVEETEGPGENHPPVASH